MLYHGLDELPSTLYAQAQHGVQGRRADDGARHARRRHQDQTILQAFLDTVEFWDNWYPNLHAAFEWPRFQTLHFFGSFWPHSSGFNKLNLESTIPDEVFKDLQSRGHDVSKMRPFGMSGCATSVMIDPATRNRFAAADARRDCYAIAY